MYFSNRAWQQLCWFSVSFHQTWQVFILKLFMFFLINYPFGSMMRQLLWRLRGRATPLLWSFFWKRVWFLIFYALSRCSLLLLLWIFYRLQEAWKCFSKRIWAYVYAAHLFVSTLTPVAAEEDGIGLCQWEKAREDSGSAPVISQQRHVI